MDFPLNGTFIVQAFNFFIVYLLLEHLFFKPMLAQLRQDEHARSTLIEQARQARVKIEELQNQIALDWHACKNQLNTQRPVVYTYKKPALPILSLKDIPLYTQDIQKITAHLRKRLEQPC